MVNKIESGPRVQLTASLIRVYIAVVVVTLAALVVMSAADSSHASSQAWGHAVIVAVFAVLLPLRLRAARHGSDRAVRAIGIIAAVLLIVNVVEAMLPDAFPGWMRVEMIAIAVLMAAVVASVVRLRTLAPPASDADTRADTRADTSHDRRR